MLFEFVTKFSNRIHGKANESNAPIFMVKMHNPQKT